MMDYYFSSKKSLLDNNKEKIWQLLKDCFWSKNIPLEYVRRFIKYSLCFGVYQNEPNNLVGFGRVISDYTTYAYICDVIIHLDHRGKGLAHALLKEMMRHPELQGLKTWSLVTTNDARSIYEKKGFKVVDPNIHLEINDLEIYSKPDFINLHLLNAVSIDN